MAIHDKRVKHITHVEYELPSPVHITEFLKTLDIARQDVHRDVGVDVADDVIEIKAHDDKVLITWWSEGDERS